MDLSNLTDQELADMMVEGELAEASRQDARWRLLTKTMASGFLNLSCKLDRIIECLERR